MRSERQELRYVYEGWEGYNLSLIHAVRDLTFDQFAFRSVPGMRSVGELAWHIADGRVDWFQRISPERCAPLRNQIDLRNGQPPSHFSSESLAGWLQATWAMIDETIGQWTVDDLGETYSHVYHGHVYAVSRQWTIWRIMAHDIHHGGQLSELLAMQDIFPTDLTLLGGHLTEPPKVAS